MEAGKNKFERFEHTREEESKIWKFKVVNLNLTTSLRWLHPLLRSIVTQKTGVSSEMAG